MRKLANFSVLLFIIIFLHSCTIKIPNKNDDGEGGNNGTPTPSNPTPFNGAFDVSLTPQLSWQCLGNVSNTIRFDIYLDTIPDPYNYFTQVYNNFYYYVSTPLMANKTYFWKVVAKDEYGESSSSIWSFTTGSSSGGLPPVPDNPNPTNGAIGVSLSPQLSWTCTESNTSNLRFDVYLDSFPNPYSIKVSNTYNFYYNVTTPLTANKMYYWKVVSRNDYGESVSNVWHFTTATGGLPTDGLVAYYPFNGNANDESGNYNNGMSIGAILTPDRFNIPNKAYSFNGINSYINVTHTSSIQPTGGLTLSSWFNLNSLNRTSSILGKGYESNIGWYSLRYDSASQKIDFQINFTGYVGGPHYTVSTFSFIQPYMWYHVTATYDGSNMKIYLNGYPENTSFIPGTLGSNYGDLKIGKCAEGYNLNGALDDIRIYNRALSNSEIQLLYHEDGWRKK